MTDRIVVLENILKANGRERPETEFLKAANAAITEAIDKLRAHNAELSRLCEEERIARLKGSDKSEGAVKS